MRQAVPGSCLATGALRKQGCTVRLRDAPTPRVVIDLDRPGSPLGGQNTRCDYLFIAEPAGDAGWLVPLELKRGGFRATEVVNQLQAGADAADGLLPQGAAVRFRPIVASGATHKAQRDKLKTRRVRYRGTVEAVRHMECGGRLMDRLSK